jgi:hypothetical protein
LLNNLDILLLLCCCPFIYKSNIVQFYCKKKKAATTTTTTTTAATTTTTTKNTYNAKKLNLITFILLWASNQTTTKTNMVNSKISKSDRLSVINFHFRKTGHKLTNLKTANIQTLDEIIAKYNIDFEQVIKERDECYKKNSIEVAAREERERIEREKRNAEWEKKKEKREKHDKLQQKFRLRKWNSITEEQRQFLRDYCKTKREEEEEKRKKELEMEAKKWGARVYRDEHGEVRINGVCVIQSNLFEFGEVWNGDMGIYMEKKLDGVFDWWLKRGEQCIKVDKKRIREIKVENGY